MKLGDGELFLGDGTWIGRTSEVEFTLVAPVDPEWPSVIYEDILDAEEIGEE